LWRTKSGAVMLAEMERTCGPQPLRRFAPFVLRHAMAPSDEKLLKQIAARDRAAFAAFYDRHAPRAFGLVRQLLGAGAEAEDVLQDVFAQVWNQAERYDAARSSPVSWLLLLARSRALDHLRRKKGQPAAAAVLPEEPDLQTPSQPLVANERALKM